MAIVNRTYPIVLKSTQSGNTYKFISECVGIVVAVNPRFSDSVFVGERRTVHTSKDTNWWEEVITVIQYDPTQNGDTEDDI